MSGNKLFVDTNILEFRKKSKLKLPDSIIAASAFYSKLPLLTADKQFKTVKGLNIVIYKL